MLRTTSTRVALPLGAATAAATGEVAAGVSNSASRDSAGAASSTSVTVPEFARIVWGFSCKRLFWVALTVFLFGAGKAVFRPVACDQVRGARGRGQGTETLAELGGLPVSDACVSQRLDA